VSETQDSGSNWTQRWQQETGLAFGAPPSGTQTQAQSTPPLRTIYDPTTGRRSSTTSTNLVGVGDVLTSQGQYDISLDARGIYASYSPQKRAQVIDTLKRKGFYGSSDPGVYANDISAFQRWLDYSNTMYMTADRSLIEMQRTMMDVGEGGGGGGYAPRYRVSSAADLGVVFKEVAKETIGRAFTDDEANRAVQAYQQLQIQSQQAMMRGGVIEEPPSADVFAQQFAQQAAPTEADAYKFLGAMNRIFSATSGAM
jgi:hypothetical protein